MRNGVWFALTDGFMHVLFEAIPGRPPMYSFSGLTDLLSFSSIVFIYVT